MHIEYLVKMANEIGAFFRAEADPEDAARQIATHIRKFWDPRMRRQMLEHYAAGGDGLEGPVRQAVALLAEEGQKK